MTNMGVETALDLIEVGRFIQEFENFTIFIGRKKNNELHNIRIKDSTKATIRCLPLEGEGPDAEPGECVKSGTEFRLQCLQHGTLHLNAAESLKGSGADSDGIMGLTFRAGARMACMFCAVIADKQLARCKKLRQSRANPL